MDDVLLSAYRRAVYRVLRNGAPLDLRVGEANCDARALLEQHGTTSAAFLTAYNPGSRLRDAAGNRAAQAALDAELASLGLVLLAGAGLDPDGAWPPEPSVLVPGLDTARARAIAFRYGQNALVTINAEGVPELVLAGPQ